MAAALTFGACSSDDARIFDESAADRLENSKNANFDALVADGGKWALEYFANTEEPGYLFVVEFRPDKSVTITTDHKWIGNVEKTETSMFDVITDNGIVLTFNTYNRLFHIFSDPADITGDNAPTNNGQDIDETGYGHEGDYEFMMMENDGQSIRLRGKKHALNAYLRHLPADADASAYLAEAKKLRTQFDAKRFPTYVMTETATGATYDITGLATGVVTCVPTASTNPFAQTETKACIVTDKGIRPYKSFDFIRTDNSRFAVPEFTWSNTGIVAPGYVITATPAAQNLCRQDLGWSINADSFGAVLSKAFEDANAQTQTISLSNFGTKPKLNNLFFAFKTLRNKLTFSLQGRVGQRVFTYYGTIEQLDKSTVKMAMTTPDDVISKYVEPQAPKSVEFIKLFEDEFTVANNDALDPANVSFVSKTNPEICFTVKVK